MQVSLPEPPQMCSSLVFYFDCFFEPDQSKGGQSVFCFAEAAATAAAAGKAAMPTANDAGKAGTPDEGAVVMSTSPLGKPTHWRQTVLHLLVR